MKHSHPIHSILLFYFIINCQFIAGQSINDPIQPRTPTSDGLIKYMDFSEISNNGQPSINIPLYEIKTRQLSVPISLNYDASGIKVIDEAGNIGLHWNLICGGTLSQNIRGVEDNGSYYPTVYNQLQNSFNPHGIYTDYQFANYLSYNTYDGAPDLFSYSIPGLSGKFVNLGSGGIKLVPKCELKVEETGSNNEYPDLKDYKITSADGTQYFFEDIEYSTTRTMQSGTIKSGVVRYLSRIVSADNSDIINFHYINTTHLDDLIYTQSQSYDYYCQPLTMSNFSTVQTSGTYVKGKQLSRIEYSGGSIDFVLMHTRQDSYGINNCPYIHSIDINNSSGTVINSIEFGHSYFTNGSTQNTNYSRRLRLDAIYLGSPNETYFFQYDNSHSLPNLKSNSVDYYGYFNGKNNQTLIPTVTDQFGSKFIGANRNIDPAYTVAGTLNKITYPTGGWTEFEYENNEESLSNEIGYNNHIISASIPNTSMANNEMSSNSQNSAVVSNTNLTQNGFPGTLEIHLSYPTNTNTSTFSHDPPYVILYNSSGDPIETLYLANANSNTHSSTTIIISPSEQYQLTVYNSLYGTTASASLTFNEPYSFVQRNYVGGLRIKKEKVFENANAVPKIIKYEYSPCIAYNVTPSHYISRSFNYLGPFLNPPPNCYQNYGTAMVWQEQPRITFSASSRGYDSYPNYLEIKTIFGDAGENGYILRNYQTSSSSNPDVFQFWSVGMINNEKYYNDQNILIKQIQNTYHTDASGFEFNMPGVSCTKTGDLIIDQNLASQCNCLSTYNVAHFDIRPRYTSSVAFYKTSTSEITYDFNGQSPVTTQTNYYYDNPLHYQISRIVTHNSDGSLLTQYLKYSYDFPIISSTDANVIALNKMNIDYHIHSPVISKTTTLKRPGEIENIINSTFTTFNLFHSDILRPSKNYSLYINAPLDLNSIQLPSQSGSGDFLFDQKYEEVLKYLDYDNYGNLISMQVPSGMHKAYLWSYDNRLPVASFRNSNYSGECSFIGFEATRPSNHITTEEDNWILSSTPLSNYTSVEPHTGQKQLDIPNTINGVKVIGLSKDFIPTDQFNTYLFSAWVKASSSYGNSKGEIVIETWTTGAGSGKIATNKIAISGSTTTNLKWQYKDVQVDLTAIRNANSIPNTSVLTLKCYISNSDINNHLFIDDVKFQPYLSESSSFTYDPFFNLQSSVSDNNGIPLFYEYDNSGRLQYTLDNDKKVLIRNDYHFKNQTQSSDVNYTAEIALRFPYTLSQVSGNNIFNSIPEDQKAITFHYLDGLGREIQTVEQQYSSNWNGKDRVQPIVYDEYDRTPISYLPYSDLSGNGSYKINSINSQFNYYQNTPKTAHSLYPFAQTVYERSPLNRIIEHGSFGDSWQIGTNHTTRFEYEANSTNDVILWKINYNGNNLAGASSNGYYNSNTLIKSIVIDENDHRTIEFRDNFDRIICKQSEVYSTGSSNPQTYDFTYGGLNSASGKNVLYTTYYLYNDLNQLVYVITPKAIDLMASASQFSFTDDYNLTDPIFSELVYAYHYDFRGRLIEKKIPSQNGWNFMVYNKLDQLVFSQSPIEAGKATWEFNKYDALGRVIITGIFNSSQTRSDLQTSIDNHNYLWEKPQSNGLFGYSNIAIPNSNTEVNIVNYYDNYDLSFDASFNGHSYSTYGNNQVTLHPRGSVTASKVRILGSQDYLNSINYYNIRGLLIQRHEQNQLNDWDVTNNEYDFVGNLVFSLKSHNSSGNPSLTLSSRYLYDHENRLTDIFKKVNTDPEIHLVFSEYNPTGQLIGKSLHYDWTHPAHSYLQHIDYRYNIRGWLTSINNAELISDGGVTNSDNWDAFGEELYYDLPDIQIDAACGFLPLPQYNGNISAIRWKIKSPVTSPNVVREQLYVYRYDDLNRMTAAYFASNVPGVSNYYDQFAHAFDEVLNYDILGNIIQLKRNANGATIDDLTYSYKNQGNQLDAVNDNSTASYSYGFNNGSNQHDEYSYDDNGNQLQDLNHNNVVTYNYLNLPVTVSTSGGQIDYIYDATGRKLAKISNGIRNDYVNEFEYNDNQLQFISTEEGRIRPRSTNSNVSNQFVYDYFIKDHLGSVRAVISEEINNSFYVATMEPQNNSIEEQLFENIPETRDDIPPGYPPDVAYTPNLWVSQLSASTGKTIGHAKVLNVTQGDKLDFNTRYYFTSTSFIPSNSISIESLAAQLASIFIMTPTNSIAGVSLEERQRWAQNTFTNNAELMSLLKSVFYADGNSDPDPDKPKAFLIWLMFDKNFDLIPASSGVQRATNPDQLGNLGLMNYEVATNGYLYIFVSDESDKVVNFDNLSIVHRKSYLLQQNNYYPFGLLIENLSHTASNFTSQNFKYNGKELQNDFNWNKLDYGARQYDPVIARWNQIDPLSEKYRRWTTYNYCINNPLRFIDPDGRSIDEIEGGVKFTGSDAKAYWAVINGKAKNVYMQLLGDQRGDGYGASIRKETAKTNYGNWAVFAAKNFKEAKLAMDAIPNKSLDNFVLSTEGTLFDDGTNYYAAAIAHTDPLDDVSKYISTRDLARFNNKKNERYSGVNDHIMSLQSMLLKVRTGGNAIFAACVIGTRTNGLGKKFAEQLSILSGNRMNIILPTGYATLSIDDRLRIWGSQNGNPPSEEWGKKFPNGWINYTTNKTYKDFIINTVGTNPVEFK